MSARERREKELETFFTAVTSENMQLKRTLWLLLRTTGKVMQPDSTAPSVTLDQLEMSPLWDLKFTTPEDAPTKLTLTAQLLPDPSDAQMRALHEALSGTSRTIKECLDAAGLKEYPVGYLQSRLMSGVGNCGEELPQLAPLRWDEEKKKWALWGL
jgi:hypothetical protein